MRHEESPLNYLKNNLEVPIGTTFASYLTGLIEKSGMTRTELSRKLRLTDVNYILHICNGRKKPPNGIRCDEIVRYLRLSEKEASLLRDLAFYERNKEDLIAFYKTNHLIKKMNEDK